MIILRLISQVFAFCENLLFPFLENIFVLINLFPEGGFKLVSKVFFQARRDLPKSLWAGPLQTLSSSSTTLTSVMLLKV